MLKFKIDKKKKYILIIGTVLLLFGLIYRIFPLIRGLDPGDEEIILKQRQLVKYRRMIEQKGDSEKKVANLNKVLGRMESGLLSGKTPSLAAADIQNILNKIVSKSGVTLKTVKVLKAEISEEIDYISIPVQFSINANIRQVKEILYGIENSRKYLETREIKVSTSRRRRGNTTNIRSDITVVGLMKPFEE
ncbi:MAG: hypothetical protein GY864_01860 [Desulfobacterales bacterium]|nr:hypothetical protein [Desulfobacterales bacterium]